MLFHIRAASNDFLKTKCLPWSFPVVIAFGVASLSQGNIINRASLRENRSSEFPTRSDTNRAVQSQKMARGLKFRI